MVVAAALSSCTGRTILHGMHGLSARHPAPHEDNHLVVWFVKGDGTLVSVTRKAAGGDRIEQAVKELLSGPSAAEERGGLGSEIPRGTILLSTSRQGKAVSVDLSRRFAMDGGTTSFETRLQQLRKTVAPLAGPADVFLNVEGKRLTLEEGEGIEIHQPINR